MARDSRWQWLHSLLFGGAAAVLAIWIHQQLLQRWSAGSMSNTEPLSAPLIDSALLSWAVLACAVAAAAAWGWRSASQPEGRVLWTGSQWRWQGQDARELPVEINVHVALDMGNTLLVRLRAQDLAASVTEAAPQWLSLCGPRGHQRGEQTQWAAFRAALYCAASRPGGQPKPPSPFSLNDRSGL